MANINTILGTKGNMLTRFEKSGAAVAVSQIHAGPSYLVKKGDKSVQLVFGRKKKAKKTENTYVSALGFAPRFVKEIKSQSESTVNNGDQVTVSIFAKQDLVKITGKSKGRGFAGGVKRWGFHGGPKTHGQSDRHRAPGSIGQTTTPGRVFKGKKMAGHFGATQETVRNLEVFGIDLENNIIEVKGAVPGPRGGYLIIEKTGKAKAYIAPPEEKPKEEDEAVKDEPRSDEREKEGAKEAAEGEPPQEKQEKAQEETKE